MITTTAIGMRVKRNPKTWEFEDQDCYRRYGQSTGQQALGRIVSYHRTMTDWVDVEWDTGYIDCYPTEALLPAEAEIPVEPEVVAPYEEV